MPARTEARSMSSFEPSVGSDSARAGDGQRQPFAAGPYPCRPVRAPKVAIATARAAARLVQVSTAHRIRLGLTGLAAIFLLVMVAAAGMRPSPSAASVGSQAEPLAVLGVAPGAGPTQFDPPLPAKRARSRT